MMLVMMVGCCLTKVHGVRRFQLARAEGEPT